MGNLLLLHEWKRPLEGCWKKGNVELWNGNSPIKMGIRIPRRSNSWALWTISSRLGVIRPDMPTMSAFSRIQASTIFSMDVITPRSMTLKLLHPNTTPTIFFPAKNVTGVKTSSSLANIDTKNPVVQNMTSEHDRLFGWVKRWVPRNGLKWDYQCHARRPWQWREQWCPGRRSRGRTLPPLHLNVKSNFVQ